ncbi:MAG TPA: glycosyltransferase [Patescibacteria group bacterium]|nr:glycosyltransferase [Patescibacteria group bacterium]
MPQIKVSCIIPTFNESARVAGVLEAVVGHQLVSEVIVINDGSKDNTEEILRTRPGIKLISYQPNRGKSHAIMMGIKAAKNDLS